MHHFKKLIAAVFLLSCFHFKCQNSPSRLPHEEKNKTPKFLILLGGYGTVSLLESLGGFEASVLIQSSTTSKALIGLTASRLQVGLPYHPFRMRNYALSNYNLGGKVAVHTISSLYITLSGALVLGRETYREEVAKSWLNNQTTYKVQDNNLFSSQYSLGVLYHFPPSNIGVFASLELFHRRPSSTQLDQATGVKVGLGLKI